MACQITKIIALNEDTVLNDAFGDCDELMPQPVKRE
jgi:hypothetical protein